MKVQRAANIMTRQAAWEERKRLGKANAAKSALAQLRWEYSDDRDENNLRERGEEKVPTKPTEIVRIRHSATQSEMKDANLLTNGFEQIKPVRVTEKDLVIA